jgi:hypothetical protein
MLQGLVGALSTVPSQSSSAPGFAHVSVPLAFSWAQAPHALVALLLETTQTWEPAWQMPSKPVEQDRGELAIAHWQKVVSKSSACPLQSLSLLEVQSREPRGVVCWQVP